jgi:hypothetical protein
MTSVSVNTRENVTKSGRQLSPEQAAAAAMVAEARQRGLELTHGRFKIDKVGELVFVARS